MAPPLGDELATPADVATKTIVSAKPVADVGWFSVSAVVRAVKVCVARPWFAVLAERCKDDPLTGGKELLGVLTWEPHATWMEMLASPDTRLASVPVTFAPGRFGHPRHLELR